MSTNSESPTTLLGILAVFAAVILTIAALMATEAKGARDATKAMQIEAVKHGAATWVAQPDGTTVFQWRDAP